MAEECVFCKIIANQIPALKVYEDENFIAFLDINPRSKGHTLLIPKTHRVLFTEMDGKELDRLGKVLKHVSQQIVTKLNAKGFNILNNNGESAGQVVKHIHFHIIPRYEDKGHSLELAFPVDEESKNKLEDIYKEIGTLPSLPKEKKKEKDDIPPPKPQGAKEHEGSIFDEVDILKDH